MLSNLNFFLSLSGLVLSIFSFKKTKDKIVVGIALILIAVMLSAGIAYFKQEQKIKTIKNIQDRIVTNLGSEAKSAQELYENLFPFVKYELFSQALEQLISKGMVEDRVIQVRDYYNREFRMRVYCMANK